MCLAFPGVRCGDCDGNYGRLEILELYNDYHWLTFLPWTLGIG